MLTPGSPLAERPDVPLVEEEGPKENVQPRNPGTLFNFTPQKMYVCQQGHIHILDLIADSGNLMPEIFTNSSLAPLIALLVAIQSHNLTPEDLFAADEAASNEAQAAPEDELENEGYDDNELGLDDEDDELEDVYEEEFEESEEDLAEHKCTL